MGDSFTLGEAELKIMALESKVEKLVESVEKHNDKLNDTDKIVYELRVQLSSFSDSLGKLINNTDKLPELGFKVNALTNKLDCLSTKQVENDRTIIELQNKPNKTISAIVLKVGLLICGAVISGIIGYMFLKLGLK